MFGYGVNLAIDELHEAIQTELNKDGDLVSEFLSILVSKGYHSLKEEVNTP